MAGWRESPVVVVCVGVSGTKLLIQGFGLDEELLGCWRRSDAHCPQGSFPVALQP
jgi:hypothetical protein